MWAVEKMDIKYEIDTCGTCCPIPMISTLKVLTRLNSGERIKVLATDHDYIKDARTAERAGKCKIVEVVETDDYDYVIIEKP